MQRWRAGAWRADAYKRDDRQNECWPMGFLDTLWTAAGGFHGPWADDHLDVEYTFYGLLALGHLS